MILEKAQKRLITLTDKERTIAKYVAFGFAGVTLLGVSYLTTRYFINKAKADAAEKLTFEEGTPGFYAKQLEMAFLNDGLPGTNVPLVRRAISKIPTKDFWKQVQKQYKSLFRKVLIKRLSEELTTTEYSEMVFIIQGKPDSITDPKQFSPLLIAKRLNAAFNYTVLGFPATDEDGIRSALIDVPSKVAWEQVKDAYLTEFQIPLMTDLRDELEFWEIDDYLDIIKNKS